MQAETFLETIETIPLFSELPESVKIEVCDSSETYYCSSQEELCREGEDPDCLFVVRNGEVLLTCDGERVAICIRGQMFGELGLLGFTENGRRMRTAVSLSECELLRLSRESLKLLLVNFGEMRHLSSPCAQTSQHSPAGSR